MGENKTDNHEKTVKKSFKILFSVLFISVLISELLVGYYLQTTITSDIQERYISKSDLPELFIHLLNEDKIKTAIGSLVREFDDGLNFSRRKRGLTVDDNLVTSQKEGPNVEFFNPKLRHELEAKDEVERARTGNKGAAPGGDAWVWLTSYSRIPVSLY